MSRYSKTKMTRIELRDRYHDRKGNVLKHDTTYYNSVPERNSDILLITQEGDRLDNLAMQFYGDPNLWWYIARVNNLKSMNVTAGLSIRVPISTTDASGE